MTNPFSSIFAEEITKGIRRKNLHSDDEGGNLLRPRFVLLLAIFIFGLGLLLARLSTLTIIEGDKYRKLSLENRVRETKIPAPRGIIYDRQGRELVRNIPIFVLPDGQIFYESVPASLSGRIKESIARDYIYRQETAHVLGFVGEATQEELKNKNVELGDMVGKMGIEKAYDNILRGTNGRELIEVDAQEREIRVLGDREPKPGDNITLSVDLNLQKIASQEFKDKKGAVIATNPKNGEILAFYSSPSFDPNRLIRSEAVDELLADPDKPFFDRSISGLYPPGSTFKIVTALSALESGAIDENTKVEDTGVLTVGAFSFGNWYFSQYGKKEGMLSIVRALKRSNDIFFYKTGEATGIKILANWGKKLGVGKTLGIDIEGEASGVMPDPAWREKVRGTGWFLGDTYHVAIGQGDLQVTPLQVNGWTNVIANDGKLCRPHLVENQKSIRQLVDKNQNECKDLGIKKKTISLIKEGMKEACSPGGTGWPLFNFAILESSIAAQLNSRVKIDGVDFTESPISTISGIRMIGISTACKTGTAEFGDPNNRTHAWFTVYAPVENPQISVTVLVEGGGEGSNVAAPIAKKILEKWFTSN